MVEDAVYLLVVFLISELVPNHIRQERERAKAEDHITRIYACGTMWHETTEEMMEFLKSVMRLDEDQHARKLVLEYLQKDYKGYYEFESKL